MAITTFNAPAIVQNGTWATKKPIGGMGGIGGPGATVGAMQTASANPQSSSPTGPDNRPAPFNQYNQLYTPTATQWSVNQAKAQATVDPHWLRTQYTQPGASSNSPNVSMNILKPLADSYTQQGLAQAQIPFADALANNQFYLQQMQPAASNNLALQNIGANATYSNNQSLLSLLSALMGG